jgi:menaquinone-dependent protoporphyrinogen IX oxidase
MKRISAHSGGPTDTSGEYEFTDWDAVDHFATELAHGLPVGQTVSA